MLLVEEEQFFFEETILYPSLPPPTKDRAKLTAKQLFFLFNCFSFFSSQTRWEIINLRFLHCFAVKSSPGWKKRRINPQIGSRGLNGNGSIAPTSPPGMCARSSLLGSFQSIHKCRVIRSNSLTFSHVQIASRKNEAKRKFFN